MLSKVLLLVAYMAEPTIWLYSMCLLYKRKYTVWLPYLMYVLVDVSITGLKQFDLISQVTGETFFALLSFALAFLFIDLFFVGKWQGKLLHIGIIFVISLLGDALSVGCLCIIGYSINELSVPGLLNSCATILSKILELFVVKIVFNREKRKVEYEILPIVLATLVMELPSITIFKRMALINNNDSLLLVFMLGQIGLLMLVVYFMRVLRIKTKKEEELLKWKHDMEMQLKGSEGAEQTLENLRELRHDMKQHFGVMKFMLEDGKYEEAKEYLARLYRNVDVAGDYFVLSNRSVSITLTMLKQYAKEKQVDFLMKIMTDEFYLDALEICAIISNVGRNAVEATELATEKYCKLLITGDENGCHIHCENTYYGELKMIKGEYCSNKGKGHGYGISIIRRIVKQHNGKASIYGKDGVFMVDIFIPRGDDSYDENNSL